MKSFRNPVIVSKPARKVCRHSRKVEPPVPRRFNFGLTSRHPLVPLTAATLLLDRSTREILSLIESGQLRWAFDIRSPEASVRQVRIFRRSIFEYVGLLAPTLDLPETEATECNEVLETILPKGVLLSARTNLNQSGAQELQRKLRITPVTFKNLLFPTDPVLRATDVALCFSCNNQHVLNLITKKSFQPVNLRQGPKASPFITRTSVAEFLKQRRMS